MGSNYDKERDGLVLKDGNLIRIQDKNGDGKVRISIYEGDEREKGAHDRTTINYDTNTGKGKIDYHNNDKSVTESTDTQCYLTTACMRKYKNNFDDDCRELTVLRWCRDNFGSKDDVGHYYKTAPIIVEAINALENSDEVWKDIYENVISVCVQAVEVGNIAFAYQTYKASVLNLEEEFAKPLLYSKLVRALKKNEI